MQLEEQFYETSAQRWKRELPWLRIFRGFRMALDTRKLLLALAGLVEQGIAREITGYGRNRIFQVRK